MKKHNIIIIILICIGFIIEFYLGYKFGNNKLRKDVIIKEQQNLIESYVNILNKEGYFNEHN